MSAWSGRQRGSILVQGTVVRHHTMNVFLQIQVFNPREGTGRAWDASPADVWNVVQG